MRVDERMGGWPGDIFGAVGGVDALWGASEPSGDGSGGGCQGHWPPRALSLAEIQGVVQAFAESAPRAVKGRGGRG